MTISESYCLNLHERYAPDWGVWECARELFANAKDAAPDTMKITSPDANTLEIYTPTVPDIAQLFIIGCGSKEVGGDEIGQFGEGLKLAALAATRNSGGSLVIRLPNQTISFSLKDHFGQQVLFADVEDSEPFEGCLCTLLMEGAGFALNGKIIEGATSHTISKAPGSNVQIFCKGVWICVVDEPQAIYSYNLNDVELNRDRSHADPYSIKSSVGKLLIDKMPDAIADRIVQNPTSWEADKCLDVVSWYCSDSTKKTLAAAMFRRHGDRAVLLTDPELAQSATEYGYTPVSVGDGLRTLLRNLVPTDGEVVHKNFEFKPMPVEPEWVEMIDELLRLGRILGFPSLTIQVFADRVGDVVGKTDGEIIWMNERLWHADNRFERVRTFIHELAHVQSGGADASRKFESSLDLIGGKLALLVLGGEIDKEPVAEITTVPYTEEIPF